MRTKYALKKIYGELQELFCKYIGVPRCSDDILLQEMRAIIAAHGSQSLDNVALNQVHAVLSDVYRAYNHPTAGDPPPWVLELQHLPFLPVRTPDGMLRLRSLQEEHYLPDSTGELADLFEGHVPIVAMPTHEISNGLVRLRRLLRSAWFTGAKFLETAVERELVGGDNDSRLPNVSASIHYKSRVTYLRR